VVRVQLVKVIYVSLPVYFIHSQVLIIQDGPLASVSEYLNLTHTNTHGRTPLEE
jgi:hypothetical protein